jgi:hypothetical protein
VGISVHPGTYCSFRKVSTSERQSELVMIISIFMPHLPQRRWKAGRREGGKAKTREGGKAGRLSGGDEAGAPSKADISNFHRARGLEILDGILCNHRGQAKGGKAE